jgi:hypothetical protein
MLPGVSIAELHRVKVIPAIAKAKILALNFIGIGVGYSGRRIKAYLSVYSIPLRGVLQ